jgi:hypothetical protein
MIKEGDTIKINVEAKVLKISRGHGICFQVELPRNDYIDKRIIWIDYDEIEDEETDF